MSRDSLVLVLGCVVVALPACTDWNAQGNVPAQATQLQQIGAPSQPDPKTADATAGVTVWETWTAPPADTALAQDVASPEDATVAQDGGTAEEDLGPVDDVAILDVAVAEVGSGDASAGVDASPADVDPACAGPAKAMGCPCASSAQCGSGLCTAGPDGPVCSESCAKSGCPVGWACLPPALVCKPIAVPDAGSSGADVTSGSDGGADAGLDDTSVDDVPGEDGTGDALAMDAPEPDVPVADVVLSDGADALLDATTLDVPGTDADATDSSVTDVIVPTCTISGGGYCPCLAQDDCASGLCLPLGNGTSYCASSCAGECPAGWTCAPAPGATDFPYYCQPGGLVDAGGGDVQVSDTSSSSDTVDISDSLGTDSTSSGDAIGVDWQGYPDANFPDGADIYGGPINSCLSVYLFQQENCGKNSPTSACIDQAGQAGSLYANYLFEPLAECEKAVCVPQCAGALDGTCLEKCIGKYCATQFLGCVANDTTGSSSCPTAFQCAGQYPDKLLTIASACYANATPAAQKQMAALIGCSAQPQTSSCLPEIAACYQSANPTATCQQVATCTGGCGSDQTCVWTCIGAASPAALQKIQALGDCQAACKAQCGGSQACTDDCNTKTCGAQVADCLGN